MNGLDLIIIIETDRVTGGYGKTLVLCEVSLRVPRSSIYGFVGPNGAGKTMALRMILGLLRPVSGNIFLFGEPLDGALPGILRRVGSLIKQPSLYDHLTGEENLEIARKLKFLKKTDTDRAIEETGSGGYFRKAAGALPVALGANLRYLFPAGASNRQSVPLKELHECALYPPWQRLAWP